MGTISSTPVPTALSVLTAPGAPLSSTSSQIPQSILNSANPTDLASLSTEANALSEVNALFAATPATFGQPTDFFPSIDSSVTDAAFGLTPATPNTTDLLQEGLATTTTPPSLDQLVSAYTAGTNNTGTVINTTG
jgi:hypothetical protein